MESDSNFFVAEDLTEDIKVEDLEAFFKQNELKIIKVELKPEERLAKIYYNENDLEMTDLDEIEGKEIKTNLKLKIRYTAATMISEENVNKSTNFKEGEKIHYNLKYVEHCASHFIKAPGDATLKFIDQKTIDKQRGVLKHFLTKLGSNLLSGSGIMNVSLPINIFDERSLLEVFAHQCRLSPYFLERGGQFENPIDKLKMTTAFAITRIHLSVTQLKPFNPIWGETFQCKIGDTQIYIEQTSHHPPIYHFLHVGKNFKSYGYQEPQASTGANSVTARTRGVHFVEYSDGTTHKIYPCTIQITGTLIGNRTFALVDKFFIVDEKNDFIAFIEFNPDDRGRIVKFFSKKKTFPDFFRGCITRLSQTTQNPKDNTFTLNKDHTSFVEIKGEWTKNLYFDEELAWDFNNYAHFNIVRQAFTLPSDSTLREDLNLLKSGNEAAAGEAKNNLEELQRKDRKLRAACAIAGHHPKK